MVDTYLSGIVFLACASVAHSVVCTSYSQYGAVTKFSCDDECCGDYHKYCCKKTEVYEAVRLAAVIGSGLIMLGSVVIVVICALRKSRRVGEQTDHPSSEAQQGTSSVFVVPDTTEGFNKAALMQTSTMTTESPAYLQTPVQSSSRGQAPPKYTDICVPPPYEEAINSPSTSSCTQQV